MSSLAAASWPRGRGRRAAARLLREPFTRRAWAEFGYVLASLPLAVVGFGYVAASIYAGALLAPTFLGLPLFAASSIGARALGRASRGLAGRLLGFRVGPPPRPRRLPGFLGWIRSGLTDRAAWRARGYLVLKLPLAVISVYAAGLTWAVGLFYIASPLWWRIEPATVDDHGVIRHSLIGYGGFYFDTWPRIMLLVAQGVVLFLIAPWVVRGTVTMDRWLIRGLLGPGPLPERVRELEQTRAQAVDDGDGAGSGAGAGARTGTGSTGLAGLAERVRTVDGRVEISSPPGGPTVVTVELPSHA